MRKADKEKMVKVEFFQESTDSFISFRVLIPVHEAGQIMSFIARIKNRVSLKPKKRTDK